MNTWTEKDAQKVREKSSLSSFRSGDGNSKTADKSLTIPAKIGKEDTKIKTDVIDSDLLLLLSKEAIKKDDVKIDFARDNVSFLNQNVDIVFTSSSHYAIPISGTEQLLDHFDKNNESERVLLTVNELSSKSPEEKNKIAKKLHCQFGRSSAEKLKKLLKSANITWDQELNREIDTVKTICDICVKYKKPKLRPAAGFSLSKDFNDAVVVDLKEIDKTYILHLINHAKRYSAAAVAKSKKKEDIAKAVIKYWIAIFGAPRVILSDNGVEFNNELLREVCEQFNITMKSTAAETPRSNGITEQKNAVLVKMIKKLKLDNDNTYSIMPLFLVQLVLKMRYKVVMTLAQTNLYLEKALICHQI